MSLLDSVMAEPPPRPSGPSGLTPGVRLEGDTGEAVVVTDSPGDMAGLAALVGQMLPGVGLDVLEVKEVRAWGDPDDPRWYVKAAIRKTDPQYAAQVARALSDVKKRRPRKPGKPSPAERTLCVFPSDTQAGKGSAEQLAERWERVIGQTEDRIRHLKARGIKLSRIVVASPGDITEGVCDNYASQLFQVTLHEADQVELMAHLLDAAVERLSALVPELWLTGVSSNHDAKRRGKDYLTDRSDNRLFTILRGLARAYSKNPDRYHGVKVWLPEDPDVAVMDLHGHGLAVIHGDNVPSGSTALAKRWRWWEGQTMGGHPAGNCDLLVSGHDHHYASESRYGKTQFICPTLDPGSEWFTSRTGDWSRPGLLTFTVDEGGWANMEVLDG